MTSPFAPASWTLALSLAAAIAAQTPLATDPATLAAALNRCGSTIAASCRKPDANFCCSPASLSLGLLTLLAGARGETANELRKVVCPAGWDDERTSKAAALLLARLHGAKGIEIQMANRVWPRAGKPLSQPFVDRTRRDFGAEIQALDFVGDVDAARRAINDQIAKATKGRIQGVVPPNALTRDTRLVLSNAVWFDGKWRLPFDKKETGLGDFHLQSGAAVRVPLMTQHAVFAYAHGGGATVLRLLYRDTSFGLDVALPDLGATLTQASAALMTPTAEPLSQLREVALLVTMPSFQVECGFSWLDALPPMGLRHLGSDDADFTGICGDGGLSLSDGLHRAMIGVGEDGTVAAATDVMAGAVGVEAAPPRTLRADRPFAFALRDLETGLVLFAGHVVDPRADH
jgi:serpin B